MTLITPDAIWRPAVDIVRRRHIEHLAALERQLELAPRTIEPLKTIDVLAFEGARMKSDAMPCALIGAFGLTEEPRRHASFKIDVTWVLAVEVTVKGRDREDTCKRRDWYTMTVIECLLSRLPRRESPVGRLALRDVDLNAGADPGDRERLRTVAQGQVLFDVAVGASIDEHAFPPDDLSEGGPGGRAADPYAVPEPPFPAPPNTVTETHELAQEISA